MGLLGNIIGDAISSGVKKGISNAVGKAVENVVKPSLDKVAEKSAEHINATADSIEQSTKEIRKSMDEAGTALNEAAEASAAASGSGVSGLEAALGGLKSRMESYATELSKNIKVCPECGEACSVNQEFCPSCGAKLPEQSAAADFTCPKCGHVNLPGSKHCGKCGEVLPGAAAEVSKQQASDAAVLAQWAEKLAQYPVWSGGREYSLKEEGTKDGHPIYYFYATGSERLVEAYTEKLLEAGFEHGSNPCQPLYYKIIGGSCYVCDLTDAFCDNSIGFAMYVNNDLIPKPQSPQPEAVDVAGLAKGLLKKILK